MEIIFGIFNKFGLFDGSKRENIFRKIRVYSSLNMSRNENDLRNVQSLVRYM